MTDLMMTLIKTPLVCPSSERPPTLSDIRHGDRYTYIENIIGILSPLKPPSVVLRYVMIVIN